MIFDTDQLNSQIKNQSNIKRFSILNLNVRSLLNFLGLITRAVKIRNL